jgi:hypothetical protein
MLNFLAKSLNDLGNSAQNWGMRASARLLYRSAAIARPRWSSPWYNLGLQAKYENEWQSSLQFDGSRSGNPMVDGFGQAG